MLVRIFPGVYCHRAVADEAETRILAAALWAGTAVITGAAAARLTFWPDASVPVVSISMIAKRKPPPGIEIRREQIPSAMTMVHRGVTLTVPALTALDLGGPGIDRALLRRAASLDQMHDALLATQNRKGNRQRRRLLYDSRDEPWSEAERRQHALLRAANITGWRTNVEIWCANRRYFVDIGFVRLRVAVEVDGYEVHSQRGQFERDRQKWSDLTAAGWTVLHFTWHQLFEQSEWVIGTIRAAIHQRSRAGSKR